MLEIYHEYVHSCSNWSLWETTAIICGIDPNCKMEHYINGLMNKQTLKSSLDQSHIIINIYNMIREWKCWGKENEKTLNIFFIINQLLIKKMGIPEKLLEIVFRKAKKINVNYDFVPMLKIESDKRGI
ncbi:hypothetical protein [Flavobacterium sp.]|uniref:hypothetical protein n=1 Tax=Flavobacterium sp. TaxID=239 RepID=UPI003F69B5DF